MTAQTDSEVKGKPPGLLRRILWWLWLIFLAVLIVFGLIFTAPWKVLVLLLIFLSAATILPRKCRKWFWLGVGVVILALIVWVFLPEGNKDWRPYTFDDELAELNAKYAVPDSQNAAVIYNQILETWRIKEPNEPNLPHCWLDLVRSGPWLSKDQPEIAAYLWYYRDIINDTLQATKFEKCFFPVESSFVRFDTTSRLSANRQWVYLLIAASNNDLAEGNINDAMEKYLALLRMGQHFSRQPTSLDMLYSIAIEALALGNINNFVIKGSATNAYLSKLEQAVSQTKHDWNSDLPGFVDSEKLELKNLLGSTLYEVNFKGKVRYSHDSLALWREQMKEEFAEEIANDVNTFSGYWFKKLFKAQSILYWFYAPRSPETLGNIIDTTFEKIYMMTEPDFNWSNKPQTVPIKSLFQYKLNLKKQVEVMVQMTMNNYHRFHSFYLRSLAMQRGTLLIIELRRYKNANGHWPEKLEDIKNTAPPEIFTDPINGDSFVYKLTEDNFILYSKGENGIDQEGEHKIKYKDDPFEFETIKDDVKIWLPKSPEDVNDTQKTQQHESVTDTVS